MTFDIPTFNTLKKNLKRAAVDSRQIKIALLGDSATQLLAIAIRGMAIEYKIPINLWEGDYDQVDRQIFDSGSELYDFKPDYVLVFKSYKKTQQTFYKKELSEKPGFHTQWLESVEAEYHQLTTQLGCKVIYFNLPEINDGVFGNYANKTAYSSLYTFRKINTGLMELGQQLRDFFICDIASAFINHGKNFSHNPSVYVNTDMLFSIDFLPVAAKGILDIIASLKGNVRKCVILDLDNTCWGGIIGDDGLENIQIGDLGTGKIFSEFQRWIKQLKERGIIIAVCSKNDEAIAKEPFLSHPDMVLRLEDVAVFVANWNPKPDNIRYIQSILNIGFDSMVFIDDNPFERNFVRENIPELIVPEMPPEPEEYVNYLQALNLFETATFSLSDTDRTSQYKNEAERVSFSKAFANEDDFLNNLKMTSVVNAFNKFTIPRVAQLTQRSNQFNLRTVRYSEGEVEKISSNRDYLTFTFTLQDKFGDNGLISVAILRKEDKDTLFIDTWIMSCRVLKRTMESFVLNEIVNAAAEAGYKKIHGEYLPTPKNGMVKDHYMELGFEATDSGGWILDIPGYNSKKTFITKQL